MTSKEYDKLKSRVAGAKTAFDQAEALRESAVKRIKEEFEVSSLKEAQALLSRLETKLELAEAEFQRKEKAFLKKWTNELS